METTPEGLEPGLTGYADVNGLHMYYEVYGEGSPLVLLHGGMLTIDLNFATLIPTLARRHQVIGIEMQGHGRTADIDREITPASASVRPGGLHEELTDPARQATSTRLPTQQDFLDFKQAYQ